MPLTRPKEDNGRKTEAIERLSHFLERSRLAEYVDLLQRPWRMIWLNFTAGVARGVGFFVGGVLVVGVIILVLKMMLHHVGGMPWIGDKLQEMIQWILDIVDQHRGE
jgi:hypothetical protein